MKITALNDARNYLISILLLALFLLIGSISF